MELGPYTTRQHTTPCIIHHKPRTTAYLTLLSSPIPSSLPNPMTPISQTPRKRTLQEKKPSPRNTPSPHTPTLPSSIFHPHTRLLSTPSTPTPHPPSTHPSPSQQPRKPIRQLITPHTRRITHHALPITTPIITLLVTITRRRGGESFTARSHSRRTRTINVSGAKTQ